MTPSAGGWQLTPARHLAEHQPLVSDTGKDFAAGSEISFPNSQAVSLTARNQAGRLSRDRDGRYYLGNAKPGLTGIVGELYRDPNEGA